MVGPSTVDRETIVVLALNVINTGTMQTIVKKWKVEAKASGQVYQAVFGQMPPTFTFKNIPRVSQNQPETMTFYSLDQIVKNSLQPIQVGALLPGIIFVVFQNVDQSVFRGAVEYTVSFEDVLSTPYSASIQGTGRIDIVGLVPGLKYRNDLSATSKWPAKTGNNLK